MLPTTRGFEGRGLFVEIGREREILARRGGVVDIVYSQLWETTFIFLIMNRVDSPFSYITKNKKLVY